MRIVIDLQGAQTESRFRGIGRYSLSLAQALARNRGKREIFIALNAAFPRTIAPIQEVFSGLLPPQNIRIWYSPSPTRECELGNGWRRAAAEIIRKNFLESLKPDLVYISSLFEGFIDDAVTHTDSPSTGFPTVVTLYDLIPLTNPEEYLLPNPPYNTYYRRKIDYLKKIYGYLAISDFTAKEGENALDLPRSRIVNISCASEIYFRKLKNAEEFDISHLGITKPFILYTGGADQRKNLPRLIEAFTQLSVHKDYQLVFCGKIDGGALSQLKTTLQSFNISPDNYVFTGYVPDENLVALYNRCSLYVFPSWQEGFGLPPLEAMRCGAPVIGSNRSSIPEVIGFAEALFDPFSVTDMARKMKQALTDAEFRKRLIQNAEHQSSKYSWDICAERALSAFDYFVEHFFSEKKQNLDISLQAKNKTHLNPVQKKLKLAYVSPLPPEKTGIANYSAELIPALSRYYDITVIVDQNMVDDDWMRFHCEIQNAEWLKKNYHLMDRILYHFGNSPFHTYMLPLLDQCPGTVVQHDFFLSNIYFCREVQDGIKDFWSSELYASHGYKALTEKFKSENIASVKDKYPANSTVINNARGIISHSKYFLTLLKDWYESPSDNSVKVISMIKTLAEVTQNKSRSRKILGLLETDFIVCTFGGIGSPKLNHRLLEAWLKSHLCKDSSCKLIFVGENDGGSYGQALTEKIQYTNLEKQKITITGWIQMSDFKHYLASTDIAVQLRTSSRGETSAAIMDCMNYGLPTIVNANGSIAELPQDAVWMLPDEFTDEELVNALETLWKDKQKRQALAEKARREIELNHSPEACARQYYEAIEAFYAESDHGLPAQIQTLADISAVPTQKDLMSAAQALSLNFPSPLHSKQLLIDISATCRTDLKTGIERVARAITMELLKSPPTGYRVEPVYLDQVDGQWRYRYARKFTLKALDCPQDILEDQIIEAQSGDILLCVDLSGQRFTESHKAGLFHELKALGVKCSAIVYDLLPLTAPECFPPQSEKPHSDWLKAVSDFDGCSCISQAVAEEMRNWLTQVYGKSKNKFKVNFFHMGADLENSIPTRGLPKDADYVLGCIKEKITFLMVGTIEPRKNYLQVLDAFDRLWKDNLDCNLVIVGREGWRDLPQEARRNIPETVDRLSRNPQLGKHLFWLQGISDEYLEKVYERSACLIFASLGEGFGLPLIEAAKHKLPIIARDLPVFREVAGQHAFYFNGEKPEDLATAIEKWLKLYKEGKAPSSEGVETLTWKESTQMLLKQLPL